MSSILTFCQMNELRSYNLQNINMVNNCKTTAKITTKTTTIEQQQTLKHLAPNNFGNGGEQQIHLSSMNINQDFEKNSLSNNKNYSEKMIQSKNLRLPLINTPVITVINNKKKNNLSPKKEQNINNVLANSPSSIIPSTLLPNILVQPLIKKWSPNESKSSALQCDSSEDSTSSEPINGEFVHDKNINSKLQNSLYKNILYLLANDVDYQKEVVLGKRIGFYRLGKELGCGNFSKVKLGVHVITKEKVATKIMEKAKMDKKAQRLLAREIDNMELMHHPNIIRLFECVETLSKVYLIMEYAGGGELYTYVNQNGKLTEDISRPIFAQLVSAVTHMHTKSISHRDIKAENVIFAQPGWVKLADFGFSCKFEDEHPLNTFCGSPPYAAPELFKEKSYIGYKVDIWALGVLLYFMLVGITPFRGDNMQDLKQNILQNNYNMPEYISKFAQNIILRMLEVDVLKRANIIELKRNYWLKDSKFPESYFQLSLNPDEKKLETNKIERKVWSILKTYGINESMIREASGKGSRNSIIGMYRIVLYQCQAKDMDEERLKMNKSFFLLTEPNQYLQIKANQQSKACTIL